MLFLFLLQINRKTDPTKELPHSNCGHLQHVQDVTKNWIVIASQQKPWRCDDNSTAHVLYYQCCIQVILARPLAYTHFGACEYMDVRM